MLRGLRILSRCQLLRAHPLSQQLRRRQRWRQQVRHRRLRCSQLEQKDEQPEEEKLDNRLSNAGGRIVHQHALEVHQCDVEKDVMEEKDVWTGCVVLENVCCVEHNLKTKGHCLA